MDSDFGMIFFGGVFAGISLHIIPDFSVSLYIGRTKTAQKSQIAMTCCSTTKQTENQLKNQKK
ncbi:hypothetical protein EJG51_000565 [Undibacterium piscinae]|uniref:Uncharacterized protein n=1 Tax=Undibacterium piscinae TaxID=2495591 RepID=A0A6M4A0U2_9BURK|nr:hypothetical protein EJG51_000565 [Undibacterium piscinae]